MDIHGISWQKAWIGCHEVWNYFREVIPLTHSAMGMSNSSAWVALVLMTGVAGCNRTGAKVPVNIQCYITIDVLMGVAGNSCSAGSQTYLW